MKIKGVKKVNGVFLSGIQVFLWKKYPVIQKNHSTYGIKKHEI